jgi:hypothetical protein
MHDDLGLGQLLPAGLLGVRAGTAASVGTRGLGYRVVRPAGACRFSNAASGSPAVPRGDGLPPHTQRPMRLKVTHMTTPAGVSGLQAGVASWGRPRR